jgi:hypothetical protein
VVYRRENSLTGRDFSGGTPHECTRLRPTSQGESSQTVRIAARPAAISKLASLF